jgi:hypothetical protein
MALFQSVLGVISAALSQSVLRAPADDRLDLRAVEQTVQPLYDERDAAPPKLGYHGLGILCDRAEQHGTVGP